MLLHHPTNDKAILDSRQRVVSFFVRSENESVMKTLRDRLKSIHDLSVSMRWFGDRLSESRIDGYLFSDNFSAHYEYAGYPDSVENVLRSEPALVANNCV